MLIFTQRSHLKTVASIFFSGNLGDDADDADADDDDDGDDDDDDDDLILWLVPIVSAILSTMIINHSLIIPGCTGKFFFLGVQYEK